MFCAEFYIFNNNENTLEFRKKRFQVYVFLFSGILIFLFISMTSIHSLASLFSYFLAILFLLLGILPLIINHRIIIDKERKALIVLKGHRKIFAISKKIKFHQIRCIEIHESFLVRDGHWQDMKDTIYIDIVNERKYKIAVSMSEIYSNEFTYELSKAIGCKVVCARR